MVKNILRTVVLALVFCPATLLGQSTNIYQYDALGRLNGVQTGIGTKTSYALDPASNRSTVSIVRQFDTSWQAQSSSIGHVVGYADSGAWADDANQPVGYMSYGPYTSSVPSGNRTATYRILIDNNLADNSQIIQLDVSDFDASQIIASRILTRNSWKSAFAYEVFELPFVMDPSRSSHRIELRVYSYSHAYVRVERVGYY